MRLIDEEARMNVETLKTAPVSTPLRRVDDVKAARELNLIWKPDQIDEQADNKVA